MLDPESSEDSGAPLVRHPANGVRGVRAQRRFTMPCSTLRVHTTDQVSGMSKVVS